MGRIANALAAFGLAAAIAGLASCEPVQNPYGTAGAAKVAPVGISSRSNSSLPPPSSAGTVAGGTIDSPDSQGLSDYLKHHSLPLVGAQVVTSPSGGKQVILFGFVASEFGKADAEQKARRYLNDPSMVVDNRIKISPELGGGGSTGNGVPSANGAALTAPIRATRPARSRIMRTTNRPPRRPTSNNGSISSISNTTARRPAC